MSANAKYYILEPAMFRLDGGAMYGIIPKPLWNKVHPADELNRVNMSLRLVLIQSANKNIIIDTGIGDYHDEKFQKNFDIRSELSPLEQALNSINLKMEDITDLVVSHLHFDHIGGLAKKNGDSLEFVFPKAKMHLHREHFKYSLSPTDRDRGSFQSAIYLPIVEKLEKEQRVQWIEGDEGEILNDGDYSLKFKISFGHTPHLLHPYDDKFIYLTDLVPTSNHVHIPWVMAYDIEPATTTKYKKEILNFVRDHNLFAIYEHDPKICGSFIEVNEKGKYVTKDSTNSKNQLCYPLEI